VPRLSIYVDEIYEPTRPLEDALRFVKRIGIDHIDLRIVDGVHSFLQVDDDALAHVERTLAKTGVGVAALGTPLFKCPLRGSDSPAWGGLHGFEGTLGYDDHLKLFPRAFQIADRFGVTDVRCFGFWREYNPDEVFDEVVEKLDRAARLAGASGHGLALENEMVTLAGTGVEQARILKAVHSPHLTAIYDQGNSGRLGGVPYPDDYEAVRGLISRVHIKFEVLDVFCGWLSRYGAPRPYGPYGPVMPWAQPNLPISGRVTIGDTTIDLDGARTFLPVSKSVGADYRGLLTALKNDGYTGDIVSDAGFRGPNAETAVQRVMDDLRAVVEEIWGPR